MIERPELSFDRDFAMIPNAWLRDERLTRKARGLLAELVSHRPGWKVSVKHLVRAGREGRDAIYGAIAELVELGYLERITVRDAGKFDETSYRVTAPPAATSGFPVHGKTASGESAPKEDHQEEDQDQELLLSPDGPSESPVYEETFEAFWGVYPRHVGRIAAEKAWGKAMRKAGAVVVLEGARRLRDDPNLPAQQFVPHPATWLNRGGWEDEPLPPLQGRQQAESDPGTSWLGDRS